MNSIKNHCFVCKANIKENNYVLNQEVCMPVCNNCKDTKKEKQTVGEYLDSLAEELVCGCI